MRIAIIGDVGGHAEQLDAALRVLGADPSRGILPEDLTVVQAGDLVHRGPASAECLAMVGRFFDGSPGRWVQLIGNHEALHIAPPQFHFDHDLTPAGVAVLHRWLDEGRLHVAAAIDSAELGATVVTHAGITSGFWRRLGRRDSVGTAAAANELLAERRWKPLQTPGCMLAGRSANVSAGPLWAEAALETIGSWSATALPFSQVHGHSTAYNWGTGRWYRGVALEGAEVDPAARHVRVPMGAHSIVGVDPCHGRFSAPRWAPLVLTGRLLEPSVESSGSSDTT